VRSQMNAYKQFLDKDKHKQVLDNIKDFDKKMTEIEEKLYQTKNRSGQDPLNYPIRLNDKLSGVAGVAGSGNFRPTDQAVEVKKDLTGKIDGELSKLKSLFANDLPKLNELIKQQNIDPLMLKKEEKKSQ
nr:glycosyl hydrolase [Thermoflexibacter sp.]